jgi:hypothetical protein
LQIGRDADKRRKKWQIWPMTWSSPPAPAAARLAARS